MQTYRIRIEGLVQGVGFRPFIYRVAKALKLSGTVENRNNGVFIFVNSDPEGINLLLETIKSEAPSLSKIDNISVTKVENISYQEFSIITSGNMSDDITGISPDIAVCPDCLSDMNTQVHRKNYLLINCTNCGPRLSIIEGVPYDRSTTTMSEFPMCETCSEEYKDITDRRFHAQPVACNNCGPVYTLHYKNRSYNNVPQIITKAGQIINNGSVIALKGTGGYHLICDAYNEKTLHNLRHAKAREGKPFAVMCRDIGAAENTAFISEKEKEVLNSWQRPIVLLEGKNILAPSVSDGLMRVGVILPYMPFHYLLFNELKTDTILFTSANFSDQPVIISNKVALTKLPELASAIITYNREISNRVDDSVCRIINNKESLLRRSRGYAPSPVMLKIRTEGIFGAGAELANCFAIGKGNQVIMSQHIGDLKNSETFSFYTTSFRRFSELFRFRPEIIARDLHPDYLSSTYADKLSSESNLRVELVQHHHAHIASCMADNDLDEKVIGVAMDGVGLGTDGNIWGGEFLVADLCDFERIVHFEYVPISGADKVSPEPWRSGLSYLFRYAGNAIYEIKNLKIGELGIEKISMYEKLLKKEINTCLYSSAGRLFDSVAAITGVCLYSTYQAEAPMRLESIIIPGIVSYYDFEITGNQLSFRKTIAGILYDLKNGKSAGEISTVFHNTVVRSITETVKLINQKSGIRKIVLSGGTFQNKYLAENIKNELSDEKYFVYFHNQVPCNDGGLALGQVAVTAARRLTKYQN
jgi:hydrogenase maturation protein HypF